MAGHVDICQVDYRRRTSTRPGNRALWVAALVVACLTSVLTTIIAPPVAHATSFSDNFNRADGGLGAGWTAMPDGPMTISSNTVIGSGGSGGDNWGEIRTGETYSPNQWSQIEVTSTQLSAAQWLGVMVRAQANGDQYVGLYYWNNGTPVMDLFKRVSGSWVGLGAFASGALPAGTQLKLQVTGSTLTFYKDGVAEITSTDTSLTAGAPGIETAGAAIGDNWSGGDDGTTIYSVGGTVSGLSGAVVLQDNAGDDLSIRSNGSFAFLSHLPSGSAYNVTVRIHPNQQRCVVANDSGIIGSADITNISVICANTTTSTASDDFNRTNGSLGSNWTDDSSGGIAISSNVVAGQGGTTGDIWNANSFSSDQFAQSEITSTPVGSGDWIGPMARMQNGGLDGYVCFYFGNGGNPDVEMFAENSGSWNKLGHHAATLSAGDQLKVSAIGSSITCQVNGVAVIFAVDGSISGGSPGILSFGTSQTDNWVGGNATPPDVAPNTPTALAQFRSDGTTAIGTGNFTNETSVVLDASVSDSDNPDAERICVEVKPTAWGFDGSTNITCGATVAVAGSTATASVTVTGLSDGTTYHWRALTKDSQSASSSWVSYGANPETSGDFVADTSAPVTGAIYDGSSGGVDVALNDGSLSSLSCNWSGFSDATSGIASYDYSLGTTPGGTNVSTWTNVSASVTTVTTTGLTLITSQSYFCNVRANDVAGNRSGVVSSDGQQVAPSLSFAISQNDLTLPELNTGDNLGSTSTLTLTTSTNAHDGYAISVYETAPLTADSDATNTIANYPSGANSPTAWSGIGFGYNVSGGASVAAFSANKFAGFGTSSSPDSPVIHSASVSGSPIVNEKETVTLKTVVSATQPNGMYHTTLEWSCVPNF